MSESGFSSFVFKSTPRCNVIEKPYHCTQCRRSFRRVEHLQRHLRTHTKEKPYKCWCGSSFTRQDLLKRHVTISGHTPRTNDLPSIETTRTTDKADKTGDDPEENSTSNADFRTTDEVAIAELDYLKLGTLADGPNREVAQLSARDSGNALWDPATSGEFGITLPDVTDASQPNGTQTAAPINGDTTTLEILQTTQDWHLLNLQYQFAIAPHLGHALPGTQQPVQELSITVPNPFFPDASGRLFDAESPSASDAYLLSQTRYQDLRLEAGRCLPSSFKIPSHIRLNRYLRSFFKGWTKHLSFLHQQTFAANDCSLEYILALACIGAQYCFEHHNARQIYLAAFSASSTSYITWCSKHMHHQPSKDDIYQHFCTSVVLLGYAPWESPHIYDDVAVLTGRVMTCVELTNRDSEMMAATSDWKEWAKQESRRRLHLVAFSLLQTISFAQGLPPILFSSKITVQLPCACDVWESRTEAGWRRLETGVSPKSGRPLLFRDILSSLFGYSDGISLADLDISPLAGYALMHGIQQRIQLIREVSAPPKPDHADLPLSEIQLLEHALELWASLWDRSSQIESDLRNFTSRTLLALAHVRIHFHLDPFRQISTKDPESVAETLLQAPALRRGPHLDLALKYTTDALGLTVSLGIDNLAGNYRYFSSIRHALAGLESAVFLARWLNCLHETLNATSAAPDLTDCETSVLNVIRQHVAEAWDSVDDLEDSFRRLGTSAPPSADCKQLALAVLTVWARCLEQNTQWPILKVIGRSLELYASKIVNTI